MGFADLQKRVKKTRWGADLDQESEQTEITHQSEVAEQRPTKQSLPGENGSHGSSEAQIATAERVILCSWKCFGALYHNLVMH